MKMKTLKIEGRKVTQNQNQKRLWDVWGVGRDKMSTSRKGHRFDSTKRCLNCGYFRNAPEAKRPCQYGYLAWVKKPAKRKGAKP